MADIIIIGAGAAGLMAARELSAMGDKVTVLEARDRIGGRIHTLYDPQYSLAVELGAEFIHGKLPVTLGLLKEAGITYHKTEGEMWQVKNEELKESDQPIDHWKLFNKKLKALKTDKTIDEFLEDNFKGDEYAGLKESVRRYAAGYDTADPARASAIALGEEWQNEDNTDQYRLDEGYHQLMDYLLAECHKFGCEVITGAEVKQINWQQNAVSAITANGRTFEGNKLVVTLPLSMLRESDNEEQAIAFSPALPHVREAARQMAMGALVKILLNFREPFWMKEETTRRIGKNLEKVFFIFSQENVPTWWTQYPKISPLLTGWLGGPKAEALIDFTDDDILTMSLTSLANIFKTTPEALRNELTAWKIVNWTAEKYTRGSYSYATVHTNEARKNLTAPVDNTIFFAGEALYSGSEMGTVEAALSSGKDVAKLMNK